MLMHFLHAHWPFCINYLTNTEIATIKVYILYMIPEFNVRILQWSRECCKLLYAMQAYSFYWSAESETDGVCMLDANLSTRIANLPGDVKYMHVVCPPNQK